MPHDHLKQMVNDQTGRAGSQIIATLVGGILVLNSFIAQWLFPGQSFYTDLLAFLGALILGFPLIKHAAKGLWEGHTHMDELVALAFLAAFAQGAGSRADGQLEGGYQAAGAIAFFMIISTLIENRTALGARASIESLIRITPTRAQKIVNGGETEVEARDLKPGDRVRVRPGDNIPGDGRVVSGASTVNQANITGESLPVDKGAGDEVFGGTINMTGVMELEITKAGADTTLGKVQDLILQAERSRAPIMRVIDRYAMWYTPTILMLAGMVLFFTKNMNSVVSMLVIACPCAIVLATPTAMVAALSAAARLGILVKNVTDLETARNLTAIVFDKTGTLTTGSLTVTRLSPAPGVDGAEVLAAAAAAEQNSKHPVAKAVVEVARRAKLEPAACAEFEEVPGRGVRALVNAQEVLVGRANWLQERGVDVSALDTAGSEGMSLLFVTRGGKPLGWIGLEDRTRPEAARSIDDLRDQGLRQLVMVTGDRWSVARRVASEMHCTDVKAEVLPAQKLELVEDLKARGHTVCVIGDGVNDAPALAAGHISIAMGAAGSDVAIHSASIALMNNNLNRVPFLIKLSRDLNRVVKQNLIFGAAFIAVFGTLGAMNLISPVVAAALHVVSSVLVIFNSARLVRAGEDLDQPHGQAAPAPAGAPREALA
ncbi:MAG: cadmium-translocating P-type ATPase [Planctomycetes bacterium]|nr:cadmium-translocating P-type ATPase [Planctomycetota bacterium]